MRKTLAAFVVVTAAFVGVALVAGPTAGAATQSSAPSPRTAFSLRQATWVARARVDTIGTSSFTVLARRHELTVNVSQATVFRVDGQTGVFGDLSVDAEVRILGTYGGSFGTLNASVVEILPSAKFVTWGTVQSIGSSSFTLVRAGGESWTVNFNGSTQFGEAPNQTSPVDQTTANSNDLAVGDAVRVFATRTTVAGMLNADVVVILPLPIAHIAGYITSIGTNSFTVLWGQTNVTVDVRDSTKYRIPGIPHATFADLAVGDSVSVIGSASSTIATIGADLVSIATKPFNPILGEVSSVGTGEFTVVHRQANLIVDVTPTTQFFQLSTGVVSFPELADGERVLLSVTHSSIAGSVDANWVLIVEPKVLTPTSST
ncbi:MAG: DUF5666 domain-containing protein [Acidimicrobiales bacterium]